VAIQTIDCSDQTFRRSPQVIGLLTVRGEIVELNETGLELFGAAGEQFRGRLLWELPAFTASKAARAAVAAAARGEPRRVRLVVRRGGTGGTEQPIDATFSSVTRDGGPLVLLAGEPEPAPPSPPAALAAAGVPEALHRELLGAIVAVAADAIIAIDADERVVVYNRGAEQIFGWTAREALGAPLTKLIPLHHHAAHRQHITRFGEEVTPARLMAERRTISAVRKSGAEFPAEASIAKLDTAAGRFYTVVLRDVTARVREGRNERVLTEAGARLAAAGPDLATTLCAVANVAVPLLADWALVNVRDGGEVYRAASDDPDPRRDATLRELERLRPSGETLTPIAEVLAGGEARLVERIDDAWIAAHISDPERRRVARVLGACSAVVAPLVARGRVLGTLTLVRSTEGSAYGPDDLSLATTLGQRAALAIDNARLFSAAQAAAHLRDEVLGVVSHDLRTPLTAIDLCARALIDQHDPSDTTLDTAELYMTIRRSARWAQHIIADLLDVASIEAGRLSLQPVPISMAAVGRELECMFAPLTDEHDVALRVRVAADVPVVRADPERLVQALGNLLGNAAKFTPAGGEVSLDVIADEGSVRCVVADTGPGIPAEDLPHVFDRFWSRRASRRGGAGLGLTIAKALAEAHGGSLDVRSELGRGTTATLTLPRVPEVEGPSDGMPPP
jgi:PAS domain S-box-containing protein